MLSVEVGLIASIVDPDWHVESSRRYLPTIVEWLMAAIIFGFLPALIKVLLSKSPYLILDNTKLAVVNLVFQKTTYYYWDQVSELTFSHRNPPSMFIKLKSQGVLDYPASLILGLNSRLVNQSLNSRELADIIAQVYEASQNSNQQKIYYRKIKLKFLDFA